VGWGGGLFVLDAPEETRLTPGRETGRPKGRPGDRFYILAFQRGEVRVSVTAGGRLEAARGNDREGEKSGGGTTKL